VARKSKAQARATRKMEEAGIKILALGGLFVLLPFFLGKSPLAASLGMLRPMGLLMLVGGGAFLFIAKKAAQNSGSDEPAAVVALKPSKRTRESTAPLKLVQTTASPVQAEGAASAPVEPTARPDTWSKAVFDVIEWRRFEAVVEALFKQAGFETRSQSHGADGGVDIWLHSRSQPGAPVSLVQCKHWQGKKVGVDKIRELRGVMAAHNVKRGQFATTSTFTADAEAFATANGVNLLDVDKLLKLIATRTPEQQTALLDVALEGDYWRPTCVNCGTKMVDRTPRNGASPFWGCPAYPKCKTTLPMRAA